MIYACNTSTDTTDINTKDRNSDDDSYFGSFDTANKFVMDAIYWYLGKGRNTATQIENFRAMAIRDGLDTKIIPVKKFFPKRLWLKNQKRFQRRELLNRSGLSHVDSQLVPIQVVYLSKLPVAYPPMGHWIADNPTIYKQWIEHLQTYKLFDERHSGYTTFFLDVNELQ